MIQRRRSHSSRRSLRFQLPLPLIGRGCHGPCTALGLGWVDLARRCVVLVGADVTRTVAEATVDRVAGLEGCVDLDLRVRRAGPVVAHLHADRPQVHLVGGDGATAERLGHAAAVRVRRPGSQHPDHPVTGDVDVGDRLRRRSQTHVITVVRSRGLAGCVVPHHAQRCAAVATTATSSRRPPLVADDPETSSLQVIRQPREVEAAHYSFVRCVGRVRLVTELGVVFRHLGLHFLGAASCRPTRGLPLIPAFVRMRHRPCSGGRPFGGLGARLVPLLRLQGAVRVDADRHVMDDRRPLDRLARSPDQ